MRRFPSGPPVLSAEAMAPRGQAYVRGQGAATGRYLQAAGVNVDLAPVLDVPNGPTNFLVGRAFGRQPGQVAALVSAFALGLELDLGGLDVQALPRPRAAPANTDLHPVRITTGKTELDRRLLPFRLAVDDGVRLVMVSNARYPALDLMGAPAFASAPIVTTLLRQQLGFDGVVITDSMQMPIQAQTPHAAVGAPRAGVDVVLYSAGGEPDRVHRPHPDRAADPGAARRAHPKLRAHPGAQDLARHRARRAARRSPGRPPRPRAGPPGAPARRRAPARRAAAGRSRERRV